MSAITRSLSAILFGLSAGSVPALAQLARGATLPFGLEATLRPHGDQYAGISSADFGVSLAKDGDTLAVGTRGSVCIFVRSGNAWVFEQTVTNGVPNSRFGEEIALSGDTLVAGASFADGGGSGGVAYVYVRSDGTWSLQQSLVADAPWGFSEFGAGVAIEGDTILVGAPREPSTAGAINAGAVHVFTRVGTTWSEQQRLQAPAPAAGDVFGQAVGLSGDTAVIGAPFRDGPGGNGYGAAFIFTRSGGLWSHQQTLLGLDTAAGDQLGSSVAASGDRVVVATRSNGSSDEGAAYVFARSGTVWSEQQKLTGVLPGPFDRCGSAVDIDGDSIAMSCSTREAYAFSWSGSTWTRETLLGTNGEPPGDRVTLDGNDLLVGAPFIEVWIPPPPPTQGPDIVTVFARPATTWLAQSRLFNPDATTGDAFATALAASGSLLAVGAPSDVTALNAGTGSVYVYLHGPGAEWLQHAKLAPPSLATGARFGKAVALQDTTLVVGAPGPTTEAGRALVFEGGSGTWTPSTVLLPSDGQPNDSFGWDVAFSGDTVVVGAIGSATAGAAYVYVRAGGGWVEQAKLLPPDGALNDFFGRAVGVSGDTIVVGAPSADLPGADAAGAAYVYVRSGTTWSLAQKLTAFDAEAGAVFGFSVAIAGDELFVGAPSATGAPQPDAGAVYAFVRSGGSWSLAQRLAAADGVSFDGFGRALALRGDLLAIGADSVDVTPPSSLREGAVYVFERSGGWVETQRLAAPSSSSFGSAVALDVPPLDAPVLAVGGFNNRAARVFRQGPAADLAVSLAAPASAVAGEPMSLGITVTNQGPWGVTGARVVDQLGPPLADVTWTCTASPGSACTGSGSGSVTDTVQIAPQGTLTYEVAAQVTPGALSDILNTATVAPPAGILDPDPLDDSSSATITVTRRADLSMDKTDGRLRVAPGSPLSYALTVRNAGPSRARVFVYDTFPPTYTGPTWTCAAQAGSLCHSPAGSGNLSSVQGTLQPGHALTFTTSGTVDAAATGMLSNTSNVNAETGVDPVTANNTDSDVDLVSLAASELAPGSAVLQSFALAGPHYYWMAQQPFGSYEIVVDAASGDVGPTLGLERLGATGSTVIQSSVGVSGLGSARSLRFRNDRSIVVDHELIRVQSGGCTTDCGDDDVYRVRAYETTARIPRFNNSGSQWSVVILQNTTAASLSGTAYFWGSGGGLLARSDFSLGPRQSAAISTLGYPALTGASGSVTVGHDGPYGALVGKGVSLEPSTGFSFDSPLEPVRR